MSGRAKRTKPSMDAVSAERERRRAERRRAQQDKTTRVKGSCGRLHKLPVKDRPPGPAYKQEEK